jgi:hypothetical protein
MAPATIHSPDCTVMLSIFQSLLSTSFMRWGERANNRGLKELFLSFQAPGPSTAQGIQVMEDLKKAGTRRDHQQGGKAEKEDWENEFHADLASPFLGFLATAHTKEFGLRAQGFRDAGTKAIRLDQDGDEFLHFFLAGALGEVP